MTTFEYFKKKYDEKHDYMVECIHSDIPVDSYHFVEVAYKFCFGGTVEVDPYFNIIGVEDTKEMFEKKMHTEHFAEASSNIKLESGRVHMQK